MKSLLVAGSVALILGALVLVGRSWSEPQKPPPAPKSRVAIVNMAYVFEHYQKVEVFTKELKDSYDTFDKSMKESELIVARFRRVVVGQGELVLHLPLDHPETSGE